MSIIQDPTTRKEHMVRLDDAADQLRSIAPVVEGERAIDYVVDELDANPKQRFGDKKPNLSLCPPSAKLHMATALMNGAVKYGPYNWRNKKVEMMTYLAAAERHMDAFKDGETYSADTVEAGKPVHHLAHALASLAILVDAIETGNAIDNRPLPGAAGRMIEAYNDNGNF